ncbi:MAG: DUF2811 domain-containing protein [Cyanobacteriota bacterium]|nr:DUF2811 domain-containing protein [Cyanobacteriota bacterium]
MNPTISILAEIPEELHRSLRDYLDTHPTWDQDQVFAAALSLFLLSDRQKRDVQLFPISPITLPELDEARAFPYICSRDCN